jgi:hypothetical protein
MIFSTKALNDWGGQAPSKEFLPEDGLSGLMIWDEDTPICAGFLYDTNSKIAWIDWIISNKNYRKKPHRNNAINYLLDSLIGVAQSMDKKYIFANNNNPLLVNHFVGKGFSVGANYGSRISCYVRLSFSGDVFLASL